MSFQNLKQEELKDVAAFFQKDVKAADAEKGPTKKELIAALASDDDGSDPVTWDDYKNTYLESDVKKESDAAEAEKAKAEEADKAEAEEESKNAVEEQEEAEEDEDAEDEVLVKYERRNPTWQVGKYTFTKAHPFKSVPASVAEALIKNSTGFRLALPSEVRDYYN